VSLAARHLEASGLPTVIMGCARDIVEHCGVPRYVWSDFPLGNPCGRPFDPPSQRTILAVALDLFETAPGPRTTVETPFLWSEDPSWKKDYLDPGQLTPETIAERRAEFDRQMAVLQARRAAAAEAASAL
jgi:hypothetical protein